MEKCYCYCPKCPEFMQIADTVHEAKTKLEQHEKESHQSKPIGTFGKGYSYPEAFNLVYKAYKNGLCPDCGEKIPEDVVIAWGCPNCDHACYSTAILQEENNFNKVLD